jgi:hypothetical protein
VNKRARAARAQAEAEAVKAWRQLRWLITGILTVFCIAGLFFAGVLPPRKDLTATDHAVIGQYDAIRHALANEQLVEARHAAEKLAALRGAQSVYTESAKSVVASESLATARQNFAQLSSSIVKLATGRPGFFLMHCAVKSCPEPCEDCPMGRFGPWIQTSPEVENPYMGLKHIKCGIVSLDQSAQ